MQVLIGENTDCWQVWLTSAFRSARSTRFDHASPLPLRCYFFFAKQRACSQTWEGSACYKSRCFCLPPIIFWTADPIMSAVNTWPITSRGQVETPFSSDIIIGRNIACVASVSNRVTARKLEREQKKKGFIPLPLPRPFFFLPSSQLSRRTREETLATQASRNKTF